MLATLLIKSSEIIFALLFFRTILLNSKTLGLLDSDLTKLEAPLKEFIEFLKTKSEGNFDQTVDISGIDPKTLSIVINSN